MGERRSKSAEVYFRATTDHYTRSRGISPGSLSIVSIEDVIWADIVVVFELNHALEIKNRFAGDHFSRDIYCLNIPDKYSYMDPTLLEIIEERISEVYPDLIFR